MRIHSFIKVCIAALTIAFAVSMGTVPVSAQTQPRVSSYLNVTQVRLTCDPTELSDMWCWTYDRIAPKRWMQRTKDGKAFPFVEYESPQPVHNLIVLEDASRQIRVTLYFGGMYCYAIIGGGSRQLTGTITGVYEISSDNSPDTCKQQTTAPGVKCNCDLRTLRPLQGAVGQVEVTDKKEKIKSKEIEKRLDLAFDPIKLVRGPNGLYVTDHHHGAKAWLEAGHPMGTCVIQPDTVSTDPTQFWVDLKNLKLVRLANERGETITETQLPKKLMDMPDDPYRTLAWMVRKKNGFCRDLMKGNTEFAEFKWADWFRTRPELPYDRVKASPKNMRPKALELATSVAARDKDLPGYHGNPTPPYICGTDPD